MADTQRLKVSIVFSRTIPSDALPKVKTYAQRIGRLLWAWNRIHSAFAVMFASFVDRRQTRAGQALWHAVKTDTAQRDMLAALLPFQTSIRPEVAEGVEWLLEVTGKLAQHRNDVVHTPMFQNYRRDNAVVPDATSGDPKRVQRLGRPDLRQFHRSLTDDLVALSQFAWFLASEIRFPQQHWTSPEIPRLRSLPRDEIPLTRSQKDRQQRRKERKHQRLASRGKHRRKKSAS